MNFSQSPIEWLLETLEPGSRLFHTGQYCGTWKASTQGLAPASFHLVISGQAWLHRSEQESVHLHEGDAVFFLNDQHHWLSSSASASAVPDIAPAQMQPFGSAGSEVGLVCGFFNIGQGPGQWILSALPSHLILRSGDEGMQQARTVFELIMQETRRSPEPAASLLQRLSDLLLIYTLRGRLQQLERLPGLAGALLSGQFSRLLERIIQAPAEPWSMDDMAAEVGLSRSAFIRHFSEQTGHTPGQVLFDIRMYQASNLLRAGHSVSETADAVGYQSLAAFTRAFQKYSGELPGAFRRGYRLPGS